MRNRSVNVSPGSTTTRLGPPCVNARRPNDEVRVVVERGGERRTLTVKLGEQPDKVSTP